MQHLPHDPFAFRHAVLDRTVRAVDEVEMLPSVAFGQPDDFFPVCHIVAEVAGVVDEGGGLFVHQCPDGAVVRLHFAYDVTLVSPLVELERIASAVFSPSREEQ